jgi:hypothetical protein
MNSLKLNAPLLILFLFFSPGAILRADDNSAGAVPRETPAAAPSDEEIKTAVTNLGMEDAAVRDKAYAILIKAGKKAVPMLASVFIAENVSQVPGKTNPQSVPQAEEKVISTLVSKLGSVDFKEREKATADLEFIGKPARPALEKALSSDDPEIRKRAARILSEMDAKSADKGAAEEKAAGVELMRKYLAIQALIDIADPAAAPILLKALEENESCVSVTALVGLQRLTGKGLGYTPADLASIKNIVIEKWTAELNNSSAIEPRKSVFGPETCRPGAVYNISKGFSTSLLTRYNAAAYSSTAEFKVGGGKQAGGAVVKSRRVNETTQSLSVFLEYRDTITGAGTEDPSEFKREITDVSVLGMQSNVSGATKTPLHAADGSPLFGFLRDAVIAFKRKGGFFDALCVKGEISPSALAKIADQAGVESLVLPRGEMKTGDRQSLSMLELYRFLKSFDGCEDEFFTFESGNASLTYAGSVKFRGRGCEKILIDVDAVMTISPNVWFGRGRTYARTGVASEAARPLRMAGEIYFDPKIGRIVRIEIFGAGYGLPNNGMSNTAAGAANQESISVTRLSYVLDEKEPDNDKEQKK